MFSSFKQQTSQWQQSFSKRQAGGPLQRLLAWLILGLMLVVGAGLLVFILVLSWILIPIMLYKHRAKVKAWQQHRQQTGQSQQSRSAEGNVIEGEVLQKRED